MVPSSPQEPGSVSESLDRLNEYKATVTRLYPALRNHIVDKNSIKKSDALALAGFLNRYPREVIVLEIGTFVGVSTFLLASQPRVAGVVSVDRNPSLAGLLKQWEGDFPTNMRVLDVAEATLARFPEQRRKVRFVAGTAGSVSKEVCVNGAPLVAFVDGKHAKESVEADLQAIFEQNPHAVAVLHDCVGPTHGPGVLAGVGAFVEASGSENRLEYRFRLFKQLDSYPTFPDLGIIYPEAVADQVEQIAAGLLEDPSSALFRVSSLRWQASLRQRKEEEHLREEAEKQRRRAEQQQGQAEKQRRRAERQRRRANRLKAKLQRRSATGQRPG